MELKLEGITKSYTRVKNAKTHLKTLLLLLPREYTDFSDPTVRENQR